MVQDAVQDMSPDASEGTSPDVSEDMSPEASEDATEDIAPAMSCSFSVAKATLQPPLSTKDVVILKQGCSYIQKDVVI